MVLIDMCFVTMTLEKLPFWISNIWNQIQENAPHWNWVEVLFIWISSSNVKANISIESMYSFIQNEIKCVLRAWVLLKKWNQR